MMKSDFAIAVDIGGTFTDVTLANRSTGQIWQAKTPTTPEDQSVAFAGAIQRVLAQAGLRAEDVDAVFHGTTVATNAILERKGAITGLIVTEGCRYVLHIGRHDVPKGAHMYTWLKPQRLVPPRRIQEASERVGVDGSVVRELDENACREALRNLRAHGIESLAVCLLHAYVNPAHERRVRELANEELPGVPCSLSSEVLPVFREYERTTATALNAYVLPQVAGYHQRLEERLLGMDVSAPLRIMKSNGGMYSAQAAMKQPIHTALSGPVAAVIGAIEVGRASDHQDIISIDVGGTSADICLSRGGKPSITAANEIAGLPIHVPMVDVHTIGAGGGSIARVSDTGALVVGPQSAGAVPGPVCYGRGGTEPTVTDANVVLGRSGTRLVGGELQLDHALADRVIAAKIGGPLSLSTLDAAHGIVELLNNNMAAAIRAVSLERGHDPRRFVLVAGGGAGALHAGRLAELLGMPLVIVPASAGLLSTLGLLASDLKSDYVQTSMQRAGEYDLSRLKAAIAELEAQARDWFRSEGIGDDDASMVYSAGLRYVNQAFEITVPMQLSGADNIGFDCSVFPELTRRFHEEHQRLFGWASETLPLEIVNVGVTALGRLAKLALPMREKSDRAAKPISERVVYFGPEQGKLDAPVYDFDQLSPGWSAVGPAIVEQRFSTVLLMPGHKAHMDSFGNILMEVTR